MHLVLALVPIFSSCLCVVIPYCWYNLFGFSCYCLTIFSLQFFFLKMGAKPTTITGLSGIGDIMLTCFVNLSRNRTVGVRLGSGEKLDDILSSMNQVPKNILIYLRRN